MLSDEERKAVDKIKTLIQYLNVWKENFTIVPEDVKYLVTILNLIEKQSKEIEELNLENIELKQSKIVDKNSIPNQDNFYDCYNYISKEESEQKERKAYIKGTNDTHELCNKKWEDKIKAKIEEAKKNYNDLHTKHLRDCGIAEQRELAKIEFGQLLLEKE